MKTASAGPRAALAITGAGVFLAYLDITVVNVALPTIADEFGSDITSASWIVTAYNVVYTALLVTAGRVADTYGRRRTFTAGLLLFAAGSALCAAAWSVPSLVAFRLVQGVGAAVLVPVSLSLLLPRFPAHRQGFAIGAWGSLGALASGLGPPIGGLLAAVDWRLIFLVNLPVSLGAAAFVHRLDEPARGEARRIDGAGAALIAVAVGALVLAIVEGGRWGWSSPGVLALLALALAATAALAWVERRVVAPVLDPQILRVRTFLFGTAASALFYLAFFGYGFLLVLTYQEAWGASPLVAGFAYAVGPLGSAACSFFTGGLVDRHGARRVALLGATIFAATLFGLGLLTPSRPGYLVTVPLVVAAGLGLALLFPALTRIATSRLPPADLASGTGIYNTVRQIGGVVGIAAVVALLDGAPPEASAYRQVFLVLAVAQLGALAVILGLGRGADR